MDRLLCEYLSYHHEDRPHLGLGKGTPNGRRRAEASGRVLSQERLGGLHHRYDRAAGASVLNQILSRDYAGLRTVRSVTAGLQFWGLRRNFVSHFNKLQTLF